jgi:hypothetical protein
MDRVVEADYRIAPPTITVKSKDDPTLPSQVGEAVKIRTTGAFYGLFPDGATRLFL